MEQERRIKKNELNTEMAVQEKQRLMREAALSADSGLEEQRAQLIERRAANERQDADARAYALNATLEPVRAMDWRTLMALSSGGSDPRVLFGLGFRELAENAGKIGQLNLTPDLLGTLLNPHTFDIDIADPHGHSGLPLQLGEHFDAAAAALTAQAIS